MSPGSLLFSSFSLQSQFLFLCVNLFFPPQGSLSFLLPFFLFTCFFILSVAGHQTTVFEFLPLQTTRRCPPPYKDQTLKETALQANSVRTARTSASRSLLIPNCFIFPCQRAGLVSPYPNTSPFSTLALSSIICIPSAFSIHHSHPSFFLSNQNCSTTTSQCPDRPRTPASRATAASPPAYHHLPCTLSNA